MATDKKVAVLIDGGWLTKTLKKHLKSKHNPPATTVYKFALGCIAANEQLFRIYYYDCYPFDGNSKHPITFKKVEFNKTPLYTSNMNFLTDLSIKDHIAFRHGRLSHIPNKGWSVRPDALEDICFASAKGIPLPRLLEEDVYPLMNQKEVDIKIGLDIAWLSLKKIVDKIILVTNDTDFIPAMKFARRETIDIVIIDFGNIHTTLKSHADEIRSPDLTGLP
ncbi:MAG: NYN domain-containing protein [Thermodesulfobacteriota bacterium]